MGLSPSEVHRLEVEYTTDGRVLSLFSRVVLDVGAHPFGLRSVVSNLLAHADGPYAIPSVEVEVEGCTSASLPAMPFRGAGRPGASLAIEAAMDAVAERTRSSAGLVRKANLRRFADDPDWSALLAHGDRQVASMSRRYGPEAAIAMALVRQDTGLGVREAVSVSTSLDGTVTLRVPTLAVEHGHVDVLARLVEDLRGTNRTVVIHDQSIRGEGVKASRFLTDVVPGVTASLGGSGGSPEARVRPTGSVHVVAARRDREIGRLQVLRFDAAVDCGRVHDEHNARAQIMSGVGMGLWAVVDGAPADSEHGSIRGRVRHTRPSSSDIPAMSVRFQHSTREATGVGETGVCGAIAAVGLARRSLRPIDDHPDEHRAY